MRIAFVNATRKWGGVKTWLLDSAEGLLKRGHTIRIYGRQDTFIELARQRVGHGEKISFGPDLNPKAIATFYKAFRNDRIDVVFTNVEKDLATAGVAARMLNIPVIQQIGLPEDIPYRIKTTLLHKWIRPKFLCSCRYIEEGFLRSLPYVTSQDSHVVLTAKKALETPIIAHSPRRLVATQQLNADKCHAALINALAQIDMPYELHIAGTGQLDTELRNLASSLGIQDKIIWHGFVKNIPELLSTCDIFLLASLSEGLPNTQQEAMAAGLLPILRNVGGVKEVIPTDLDPWVLPYEATAEDFRKVIEKALTLPDAELLALRAKARQACTDFFDIDAKTDELEAWLSTLVHPQPSAPHSAC